MRRQLHDERSVHFRRRLQALRGRNTCAANAVYRQARYLWVCESTAVLPGISRNFAHSAAVRLEIGNARTAVSLQYDEARRRKPPPY